MGESSSGAMPVTIRGVHVINEPVWYQVLMKMIAPFLTDGESVTQVSFPGFLTDILPLW